MNRIIILSVVMAMVFALSMQAQADLTLLGQGTSILGTYNLIYDTDRDITWYDYAFSPTTSYTQAYRVSALTVNFGGIVYDDWRLPTALNEDFSGPCQGYNCTESEMGHLFYTELGNVSGYFYGDNTGDFENLKPGPNPNFWTSTRWSQYNTVYFDFDTGQQSNAYDGIQFYAMAVRDGRAVAPEPISSLLFVTGGILLAGKRFIRRKA